VTEVGVHSDLGLGSERSLGDNRLDADLLEAATAKCYELTA